MTMQTNPASARRMHRTCIHVPARARLLVCARVFACFVSRFCCRGFLNLCGVCVCVNQHGPGHTLKTLYMHTNPSHTIHAENETNRATVRSTVHTNTHESDSVGLTLMLPSQSVKPSGQALMLSIRQTVMPSTDSGCIWLFGSQLNSPSEGELS
jgi:hypothetical protein